MYVVKKRKLVITGQLVFSVWVDKQNINFRFVKAHDYCSVKPCSSNIARE